MLAANWSSACKRMTRPGHWSGLTGTVLYASATSRMEAWEPGGRRAMSKATVEKVPQVHGKSLQSMCELICHDAQPIVRI